MNTFVMVAPSKLERKRKVIVSSLPHEGLAKMDGYDSQGRIRVWARSSVDQKFIQVEYFEPSKAELVYAMVKQLREDAEYRGRILREARAEKKDGETWD